MSGYQTNTYTQGKLVTVSVTFYNAANVPTDPSVVTLEYKDGTGTDTTVTTGFTHPSAGVYSYNLDTSRSTGQWKYRWVGTGTVQDAAEGVFFVESIL